MVQTSNFVKTHSGHVTVIHKLHIFKRNMLRTEFNLGDKQVLEQNREAALNLGFVGFFSIAILKQHAGLNNSGPTGKMPLSIQ